MMPKTAVSTIFQTPVQESLRLAHQTQSPCKCHQNSAPTPKTPTNPFYSREYDLSLKNLADSIVERVSRSHTPMAPKKSSVRPFLGSRCERLAVKQATDLAPKVKTKYIKKKKAEEALESKACFKCKSVYETVPDTLKGLWRNCEKNLGCNNWYCSACLPANFSKID